MSTLMSTTNGKDSAAIQMPTCGTSSAHLLLFFLYLALQISSNLFSVLAFERHPHCLMWRKIVAMRGSWCVVLVVHTGTLTGPWFMYEFVGRS